MRHNGAFEESLEQRLGRYAHPAPGQVEADVERAWENIRAEAKRIPPSMAADSSRLFHQRRARRSWSLFAAAAAVVFVAVVLIVLWPAGSAAVVEAADGGLYRIVGGKPQPLKVGERVSVGQTVRSEGPASATLAFTDGSRFEMRSMSEVALEEAREGFRIRLTSGSVIVNTTKQTIGRQLYVATRDVTVPVVGGVLLVKADEKGSSVGVIKGESPVQPDKKLEDLALQVEIGWSREAAAYLGMLHESLAQTLAARQVSPQATPASDKPQFEEASVRPCPQDFNTPQGLRGGGSNSLRLSPARLDALCMTPATLIRTAFRALNNNKTPGVDSLDMTYGLGREDGTRVRGGPDWVRSEKYTISAVAQGRVDAATLRAMLWSLLENRFRLKVHVDTEDIPVMALKVAKGGLKIKPAEPCIPPPPMPQPATEEDMRQYYEALGDKPFCRFTVDVRFPNTRLTVVGGTMSRLAALMIPDLRGPFPSPTAERLLILNQTGIPDTETFNLVLEYGADPDSLAELQRIAPQQSTEPLGPSIIDALGKFGLTLERSKGSREFVVIDHIERPSPN